MSFARRNAEIWKSFRSLPLWVQVWVAGILSPANAVPFFLLDTWLGAAAAIATGFVVATNLPIMVAARGMTRLMSVPHLFAWIPLQILIPLRLTGAIGGAPATGAEWWLGVILFVVNGISLVFDVIDSWRWLRGEREVAGAARV
jgi:hypothetical protein